MPGAMADHGPAGLHHNALHLLYGDVTHIKCTTWNGGSLSTRNPPFLEDSLRN